MAVSEEKEKGLVCVVDVLDVKGEGVSRQCVCLCVSVCVFKNDHIMGQIEKNPKRTFTES